MIRLVSEAGWHSEQWKILNDPGKISHLHFSLDNKPKEKKNMKGDKLHLCTQFLIFTFSVQTLLNLTGRAGSMSYFYRPVLNLAHKKKP